MPFKPSSKLDSYEKMQLMERCRENGPTATIGYYAGGFGKATIEKLINGGMIEFASETRSAEWINRLYKLTPAGIARCTELGWFVEYYKFQATLAAMPGDTRTQEAKDKFAADLAARVAADKIAVEETIAKAAKK